MNHTTAFTDLQASDQRLALSIYPLYGFAHFFLADVAVSILVEQVESFMLQRLYQ